MTGWGPTKNYAITKILDSTGKPVVKSAKRGARRWIEGASYCAFMWK